jgi:predicted RNA-binding Zn-ribbon protein involved in translation (DUF1610 family)
MRNMASRKCPKDGKNHDMHEVSSRKQGKRTIIEYICTKCGQTAKDVK